MSDLLDRVVERTRIDLEARRGVPLPARVHPPPSGRFRAALTQPGLSLIAEVKPRSPSHGPLARGGDLEPVLAAYRRRADAVSVLIDTPFFGGGLELLRRVRAALPQPILAKGFILDTHQLDEALSHGADAVLLIARLLDDRALVSLAAAAAARGLDALVEVHDDHELDRALRAGADLIGVNARDLDTLEIDLEAARARLSRLPARVVRVAESGLHTPEHVDRVRSVAHACLIGAAFMSADDVGAAMEALGW